MDFFENLETLWTPVIIRVLSSIFSGLSFRRRLELSTHAATIGALIILAWFFSTPSTVVLIAAATYVNVYLCLKELELHWRTLLAEKSCLDKFR